jgi:hypothetical protein
MALRMKKTSTYVAGKRLKSSGGSAGRLKLSTQASGAPPIPPDTITLTQGMTVTTVVPEGTYDYTDGDSVILDSTYLDTSYNINQGFFFISVGNTPVDLSTLGFPSSGVYNAAVSGIAFFLNVTVPPLMGLVFTSTFGPQLITGGESVSFDPFAFATPTLTTTLVDTSWSLVDQFSTPIANGILPINNLKTLWTTYSLSSGEPYTMTASGITFTITREAG